MEEIRALKLLLEKFLQWMRVRNYSPSTVKIRYDDLMKFINWCEERAITDIAQLDRKQLENYRRWLATYRRGDGHNLDVESQGRFLSSVRVFFRYAYREGAIVVNPAAELESPRRGKRLPKTILTLSEVERILQQPDINTARGLRDRAILETFYSTGVRRAELVSLKIQDLDTERGMLAVRGGKGSKDRIIPIGERALAWLEKYLQEARGELIKDEKDEGLLFVSSKGKGWSVPGLGNLVRDYVRGAELGKKGACHLFRHTMATLMLEGGADIRYIQQMLGHEELSTTQIYTRVSDRKLKEIHTLSHPGAQLKRVKHNSSEDDSKE